MLSLFGLYRRLDRIIQPGFNGGYFEPASCWLRIAIISHLGYLLGESDQENILKDPGILKRLNDIEGMEPEEKSHVLFTLDALIQKIKLKNIAAL